MKLLKTALAALVLTAPFALADDEAATKAAAKEEKVVIPFHGNEKCPISGRDIDQKKFVSHEGEKVYLCCAGCVAKAQEDPAAAAKKAYAKVKKLDNAKCPISGQPIAEGKGQTVTFQGKEARVCCGNCAKNFTKTPNLNLTKAENPKLVDAKNEKCPIMTKKTVKPDMFVTYKGKIVHICCPGCDKKLQKDPKLLDEVVKD